ncbi:NADH-quinone oxidoreductase subunit [Trichinella spiralis]|uniref:NADH-quinone oxidoreductase subunit n=1 Tax=Trichinella spiralis TaxID=6334 RepID=A0ABR3KWP0_TRISP
MEIAETEDKKKKKLQQESGFTLDESTEPGIIYMSTIPYSMTVKQNKWREKMAKSAENTRKDGLSLLTSVLRSEWQ